MSADQPLCQAHACKLGLVNLARLHTCLHNCLLTWHALCVSIYDFIIVFVFFSRFLFSFSFVVAREWGQGTHPHDRAPSALLAPRGVARVDGNRPLDDDVAELCGRTWGPWALGVDDESIKVAWWLVGDG